MHDQKTTQAELRQANEILRKANAKGFASVFNGKDFDGWDGPLDQYEVTDGAIGVCGVGNAT